MLAEMSLGKYWKLYAALMDLEKPYKRIDRLCLWDVLRIYGVVEQLPKGIRSLYKDVSPYICVIGGFSRALVLVWI